MKIVLIFVTTIILFLNCSIQKIALNTTTDLVEYGIDAIYAEPDLKIAEQAVASNLKLLEGFHLADKNNKKLLLMLTQGFASYSLGFLEDDEPERASLFYLRAKDYGLKLLSQTKAFKDSIPTKEANFRSALKVLKPKDVPALFWCAFAWAGWVNLNRDNPQAVFELNIVKAMMQRVLKLDETFFFGAAHLFFGAMNASMPKMLGGDPEKAKEQFDRCLDISDGKFMIAKVYLARYYGVSTLDEELFDKTLAEVLDAPPDILPGYELLTSVAKDKAKKLMERKEDLL
jgi:hypothetical protein